MIIKEIEDVVQKYVEASSKQWGRYLITEKQLSPGEIILREKPLAVGPAVFNKNLLCFGCSKIIPNDPIQMGKVQCKTCDTAIFCSPPCEERQGLHTHLECGAFKKCGHLKDLDWTEFRHIIFPLRLWLLREANEESWEEIMKLEAHLKERKDTQVWHDRQETVINVLKRVGLVDNSDDLLQRICGIIDVNSFELRSPGALDNSLLRGLYPKAALMAHDCRGNTYLTVDDDFNLTVYASVSIEKGGAILFNYTSSLMGTFDRRTFLWTGKYFNCNCAMCRHPEELGAHLSSILCPRCKKGYVGVEEPYVVNTFIRKRNWFCGNCKRLYSGKLIRGTLDLAEWQIMRYHHLTAKDLEKLIENLTRTFHPHHSLLLNLKQKLLTIYRKELMSLHPEKHILRRMVELCRELVEVLEIVEPGISRLKGIMLYEMHRPIVILANRMYASREISSEELAIRLEEATKYLKNALSMLLLEPASTPEGLLVKRALQEYKTLNQRLEDVRSLPSASESSITFSHYL
ncbi:SET domain-containing protein SmydA-8-like [Diachasmimorpha longicaudata]|uniref:SET domain-containing protein SmydA-8-like n=1 Tax=Diachasmimorpha longicaudata TaxID=58733 RepID=UPI0030B8FDB4